MSGRPNALPVASVPTVRVSDPLAANVALAPAAGAVNVTGVPVTALVIWQPLVFASSTCNGIASCVLSLTVCGVPPTGKSSFGGLFVGHNAPLVVVDGKDCALACGPAPATSAPTGAASMNPSASVCQHVRVMV